MDAIRRAALVSVSRACGFFALGVLCVMLAFAHDPQRSAQAGSLLFFALALGLIWKAQLAPRGKSQENRNLAHALAGGPSARGHGPDRAECDPAWYVYLLRALQRFSGRDPVACSCHAVTVERIMKQMHPVATAATPLRSLTAIALDTETTSLDVHHARILEIGEIAILNGRLVPDLHFASLVNPQAAIPPFGGNPWHHQ